MLKLLTRQEFKDNVFKRDNYKCVVPECEQEAIDAHHIMDRKLFSDGGYYLNNGASLCAEHHLDAETGKITVKEVLEYSKISLDELPIPDNLTIVDYVGLIKNDSLDKWGEKKKEIDSINEWWKQYENKENKKETKERK